MQNVDYTKALQNYRTSQGFLTQASQPQSRATLGTALGRILTSYFAKQGMDAGQQGMLSAEQTQNDARAMDFSNALSAYRGDTPYQMGEDEMMPGEAPIEGLKTMGQDRNRMAMAEAMMSAQTPGMQTAGLSMLAQEPEKADIDNKITAYQQAMQLGLLPEDMSFPEFAKIGANSTTINNNTGNTEVYGKPEGGMMPNPDFNKDAPVNADNPYYIPQPGGSKDPASKNQKDYAKLNSAIKKTEAALDRYETMFDQTGTKIKPDGDKLALNTTYKDLMLQLKELFNLGVLNGPDLEIMEQYLQNPTSGIAVIYEAFGGRDGFKRQMQLVRDKIQSEVQINREVFLGESSGPKEISSQEEYDALPPNTEYLENGNLYRKP